MVMSYRSVLFVFIAFFISSAAFQEQPPSDFSAFVFPAKQHPVVQMKSKDQNDSVTFELVTYNPALETSFKVTSHQLTSPEPTIRDVLLALEKMSEQIEKSRREVIEAIKANSGKKWKGILISTLIGYVIGTILRFVGCVPTA